MKYFRFIDRLPGPACVQTGMASYEIRPLPPERYTTCTVCRGTGKTEEVGDLHRSAGIIPCPNHHCHCGILKSETVMTRKPKFRVKARRRLNSECKR